jgi:hypothetical protein
MRQNQRSIPEMNRGTTEYRIHVKGKIQGDPETYLHTYRINNRPANMDEVRRIAGDFDTLEKALVEEVTTITKSRILNLE